MRVLAGTSGFSYKPWKGPFYPEDLKDREMLSFYGQQLPTVEINSTFYRMPRRSTLENWHAQVPEDFRFVLKASQRITHKGRLKDVQDSVAYLWDVAGALGPKLGPVLFQMPPYLRKDLPRLQAFVDELPEGCRAAFEFRHESWRDDQVHECLRARNQALCLADTDEGDTPALVRTADWGYLRLRREAYSDEELKAWHARAAEQGWQQLFVFFKHEDDGIAPALAKRFMKI